MKTVIKEKNFDTVAFFRKEKERIAKETENMNFTQLKAYLAEGSEWAKKRQAP